MNDKAKRQYKTTVESKLQALLKAESPRWLTRRKICERFARDYQKVGNVLDQLAADGILEKRDYRQPGQRGAPRFEYRLAQGQG